MVDLLQLQKQAVRLISGSGYLEPTLQIFLRLKIIPIVLQFKLNKIVMVYKSKNKLAPSYLSDKFAIEIGDVTDHQTRSSSDDKLYLPRYSKQYAKSFEITGIKLWNKLPTEIRRSTSVAMLKTRLENYVLDKMANLSETGDIWCSMCTMESQFETLFCHHIISNNL
jgi:hypothetical protein